MAKNAIQPLPPGWAIDKRHWHDLPEVDQEELLNALIEAGLLDALLNVTVRGERYLYSGLLDAPRREAADILIRVVETNSEREAAC